MYVCVAGALKGTYVENKGPFVAILTTVNTIGAIIVMSTERGCASHTLSQSAVM